MPFTYTLQFLSNSFPHIPFPHISLLHTFNILSSTFPLLLHFPFYHTAILTATFPLYGSISPFIPLIPFYLSNPPIIPPSFPFSPFPPVSPFAAVSRGFSVVFGLFRRSWSGPGGAGSAGGYTCLLAAVPASVRPSSAVPLVLRGGPGAVLPGVLPFCSCSGSVCPFFRACLFRARGAGRIGGRSGREYAQKSGAAALVRRRRSWACILFSGCKGKDDYNRANQAINRCSHIVKLLCGRRLGAAGQFRGQAL